MEDLSRLTLRALLTLARERFGSAAASLKTREELVAALSDTKAPVPPAPLVPAEPSVLPAPSVLPERSRGAVTMESSTPLGQSGAPVVTRDFFRRRS